jgi:hypothetical protein
VDILITFGFGFEFELELPESLEVTMRKMFAQTSVSVEVDLV